MLIVATLFLWLNFHCHKPPLYSSYAKSVYKQALSRIQCTIRKINTTNKQQKRYKIHFSIPFWSLNQKGALILSPKFSKSILLIPSFVKKNFWLTYARHQSRNLLLSNYFQFCFASLKQSWFYFLHFSPVKHVVFHCGSIPEMLDNDFFLKGFVKIHNLCKC